QVFIARASGISDAQAFERKLYVIRKRVEHALRNSDIADRGSFYLPSLSANTLIYKGMLSADQIETMFPDIVDPLVESALALVHQRFSTTASPSWPLAHPYRYIAHNGEINTLRVNINWMHAREALCRSNLLGDDLKKILPIVVEGGSDSATFDNVLELLVMAGSPPPPAVLLIIPEAWSGHEAMPTPREGFYDDHGLVVEPSEGPGAHRLHRRHGHRRRSRPERAPSLALLRDQGRPRGHGLRGRRAGHSRGPRAHQGAPPPRAHLPRRHRAGAHHRRRRAQACLRD